MFSLSPHLQASLVAQYYHPNQKASPMQLYQSLAQNLHIRLEWENPVHLEAAEEREDSLLAQLPQGSGFDSTPTLAQDGETSPTESYLLHASFHRMDEHGGYDGWFDFTIRVFQTRSMIIGWDAEIISEINDEDTDLADYVIEAYSEALAKQTKL